MLRTLGKVTIVVASLSGICFGQYEKKMKGPPPATLRIIVTIDGQSVKAKNVQVELTDEMSAGVAPRGYTNQAGEVTFATVAGAHQVHISGEGIKPYEGEVDINPNEMTHLERIRVQSDGKANQDVPGQPVAAVRLGIPENARKAFDKATQAMHNEKWEDSRVLFEKAIAEYATYDMAYNGLGIVETQLKNTDEAQQAFLKAIQLNAKYAEAQRNLARLLITQHNNNEATAQLQASLATEPNDVWALGNLAYLQLQAHDFNDALSNAQRVHTLAHPNMPFAHMVAAYAAEELGKNDVAEKELHLYLEEDPQGPNVGRARQELDRLAAVPKP